MILYSKYNHGSDCHRINIFRFPVRITATVAKNAGSLTWVAHTTIWFLKVKVQVFYSLISSLKTYHRTLHITPWSLDLFIRMLFQLPGEHTVLQSSEAFEGKVSCPITHHLNNVPRLRGEKHDISLKILHQAGFETAQQAATSAERHALTIAPCPVWKGGGGS